MYIVFEYLCDGRKSPISEWLTPTGALNEVSELKANGFNVDFEYIER